MLETRVRSRVGVQVPGPTRPMMQVPPVERWELVLSPDGLIVDQLPRGDAEPVRTALLPVGGPGDVVSAEGDGVTDTVELGGFAVGLAVVSPPGDREPPQAAQAARAVATRPIRTEPTRARRCPRPERGTEARCIASPPAHRPMCHLQSAVALPACSPGDATSSGQPWRPTAARAVMKRSTSAATRSACVSGRP